MRAVLRLWKHPVMQSYVNPLLFAVFIVFGFLRPFVVEAYRVDSGSMETTLMTGDRILVSKFTYGVRLPLTDIRILDFHTPERGDIVLFVPPHDSRTFVKRVIGMPGDIVETRGRQLYVNGDRVEEEEHARYQFGGLRRNFGPYTVPEETLFVMGDNRDNSSDSRSWGPVPMKELKGQAFLVYWSNGGSWWQLHRVRLSQFGKWLAS